MILSKARAFPALIILGAMLSGCGSDSTGPDSIDSNAALQSLTLGLQGIIVAGPPTTPAFDGSFGGIAPLLDQVAVTIDGSSENMFALGLRETFPDGTCEEDLFGVSFPDEPATCTPPSLGLVVLLWQAHAANQPPDRMIFIIADEGTTNFDFTSAPVDALPAVAIYVEGDVNLWSSISGTLVSQVSGTNQTCNLPLPPYAKSGTCSIATFNEHGSIVFEPFSANAPRTQRTTVVIPSMNAHGLWLAISEVQPVPLNPALPTVGVPTRTLSPRLLAARVRAARLTPAR
ncbi:MAG TPA: hypothetical protein VK544_00275 [Gemmatimonadaceae bacterium]|jgi:hypothetical protein|nr:hypothetical protein [Gemmatimonadaceae bacterium]